MARCIALVLVLAALALLNLTYAVPISSRQLLPPRPGYVPVYIRNGDTPLEEINLELAEAFHAIPSGRSAGRSNMKAIGRANDEEPKSPKPVQPAPVKEEVQEGKAAPKKKEEPVPVKTKEELKSKPIEDVKVKAKEDPKAKNVKKEQVVDKVEKVVKAEEIKVSEPVKEIKQ